MSKVYNPANAEEMSFESTSQLQEAILNGTAVPKKADRFNVLDKNGVSYSISGSELKQALGNGYTLESPDQTAVREYVKDNQGLKGMIKVGISQFADEFLGGVPEAIYDQTADPIDVAKKEALKREHSITNTLSGIAGFGTSMLTGVGPLSKLATVGAKVGAKAGTKAGAKVAEKVGTNLASEILAKATKKAVETGVESAVIASPQIVTNAVLGNTDEAAEALLYSVGIGALFGATGSLAKDTVTKAIPHGLEAVGKKSLKTFAGLDDEGAKILRNVGQLDESMIRKAYLKDDYREFKRLVGSNIQVETKQATGKYLGRDELESLVQKRWKSGKEVLKNNPGASIGEAFGMFAGLEYLAPGAGKIYAAVKGGQKAIQTVRSAEATVRAISIAENALMQVNKIMDSGVATAFGQGARKAMTYSAMRELVGEGSDAEQYARLQEMVADMESNDYRLQDTITSLSADLEGSPELQAKFDLMSIQAMKYIGEIIPKSPTYIAPEFQTRSYKPSDNELHKFKQKLEIIVNPMKAFDALASGTLSKPQVQVLERLYPSLLSAMRTKILDYIATNKPKLRYSEKIKLNTLLGIQTDSSLSPSRIKSLQSSFTPSQQETQPVARPAKFDVTSSTAGGASELLKSNRK